MSENTGLSKATLRYFDYVVEYNGSQGIAEDALDNFIYAYRDVLALNLSFQGYWVGLVDVVVGIIISSWEESQKQ